jgi:hypothetical protein
VFRTLELNKLIYDFIKHTFIMCESNYIFLTPIPAKPALMNFSIKIDENRAWRGQQQLLTQTSL